MDAAPALEERPRDSHLPGHIPFPRQNLAHGPGQEFGNAVAWRHIARPIIPIDLRQDDCVVSHNLLRQRKLADRKCPTRPRSWITSPTPWPTFWSQGGTDPDVSLDLGTAVEEDLRHVGRSRHPSVYSLGAPGAHVAPRLLH